MGLAVNREISLSIMAHTDIQSCKYLQVSRRSTDRIIRDVLIVGCNSNHARDKIIRQGEAVTLNEVIEILQTEESTHSTMQQIRAMTRSLQVPYTIRHTIVEVRNPKFLTNRIPVLLLQVPRRNAFIVVKPSADNI